jgi:hypothetical protein
MKCVSPADNPQAVTSDLGNLYVVLFLSYVNTTLMRVLSLHYQALHTWQHLFLRTVSQVTQSEVLYIITLFIWYHSTGINTELLALQHK